MPRAGGTLLGVLLNQNPNICMTANSIVPDILFSLYKLKITSVYRNFPDENSLHNVLKNVFTNYYKDWKAPSILDNGPWGTPGNILILKKIIQKPKFIILYRPVLECLASFVKVDQPPRLAEYCESRMDQEGRIGKELWSIKNVLLEEKENCHITTYKKLSKNPKLEIKKICKFLNIPFFAPKLSSLKQLKINKVSYNDKVLPTPLHTIKADEIKYTSISIKKILTPDIIKKYEGLDVV
tara:strand:- start:3529 stop:4245 length:717 start_codon:yes stop_codon:yes gene_type:complete